jgi:signal recognition particle receptor subunit beta
MVVVNTQGQEINAKIVYYGPALSGKTTNLEQIYDRMPSNSKGKMVSMKTRTDRTLFFDFLPIELGDINGYRTRMLLYTVPGQVYYNATRKLVLKGADAIVFVADSSPSKLAENIESLRNLEENLNELGLTLDVIPWVIQYNKRDLPDAAPVRTLENELNLLRVPSFEAVATQGLGVYETFQGMAGVLFAQLSSRLATVDQRSGKSLGGGPEPKSGLAASKPDAAVSKVIDDGLREMASAPVAAPSSRAPGSSSGEAKRPAVSGTPEGPDTGRPATRVDSTQGAAKPFRFVALDATSIDESVGRVVDLERDSDEEVQRAEQSGGGFGFITDPCRVDSRAESEDLAGSISPVEEVSLSERAPQEEDECVITVPVTLSRSQTRKTIPIKLRLDVQIVGDDH